jgi:hypothetical protein
MNYRTKKTVVRHGVDQSRNAPKLASSTIHQMESSSQLQHPEIAWESDGRRRLDDDFQDR